MSQTVRITCLIGTLSLFLIAAPGLADEEPAATFSDPVYGFSLEVPGFGSGATPTVQRAMFAGPAAAGFAPNCNVQVQFVTMPFASYVELTKQQFAAAEIEVASIEEREVSALPAALFEYAGSMNGSDLRFLAVAVGGNDRVWLVTCTAQAALFEEFREEFTRVVESLEISPP